MLKVIILHVDLDKEKREKKVPFDENPPLKWLLNTVSIGRFGFCID